MRDHCAKKVREGSLPCDRPIEYVHATPPEVPYSGWHHTDRRIDNDHYPTPKGWLS